MTLLLAGCGAAGPPAHPLIPPQASAVRCVSADGGGWTLALDRARGLADGKPASFRPAGVTWRDAGDGGAYALDLASGQLTVTRASSTGGYQVFFACRPPGAAR